MTQATSYRLGAGVLVLMMTVALFAARPSPPASLAPILAGRELSAVYREGTLHLSLPDAEFTSPSGVLDLEVLDANDRTLARGKATRAGRGAPSKTVLAVEKAVPIEDLAWARLRMTPDTGPGRSAGGKIVSLSEVLRLPVVRLFAQSAYAAGSPASARVLTVSSNAGRPLRGSLVRLELVDGERATDLYSGRTDGLGTVEARFRLPEDALGARSLRVTASTPLGTISAVEPVRLERRTRILLTTDKPIYQPGQTMHLRALALDGPTRQAADDEPIALEVEDAKGNTVFRQRGRTDRFGIAAADFELADEVNFGPYHVRAVLGAEPSTSTQEKTVTVDRYTLPKFKVEIALEGDGDKEKASYFAPGETVEGTATARYLFGKPVANADVQVRLTGFDVAASEIGGVSGRTDAEGRFTFSSKLPDFLAGRSTEQGSAPVSVAVEVTDGAAHKESKTRDVLVSRTPILITAVPESGDLIPGMDNRVYLLTSYPDGAPAETTITGDIPPRSVRTDAGGIGTVSVRPLSGPAGPMTLHLRAVDARGRSAEAAVALGVRPEYQSLRLRTDRAVARVGESLRLETLSLQDRGAVYIDAVKDGQTVLTRAVESAGGKAELVLDLTPEMAGALELRAYTITADADPVTDRRLVYVEAADDLKVEVAAARERYQPGEEARIDFRVTDPLGRPVTAALGVEIVDEAVFALSDRHPGFEKVFLALEKELLTPRYEIHQLSMEQVLRDDFEGPKAARIARRERAAQVLFAAAGSLGGRDVSRRFGGAAAIETKRAQYGALYATRITKRARELASALTVTYRSHAPSREGFERDVRDYLASDSARARSFVDPWGRPLAGRGTLPADSEYAGVQVVSAGPDGRASTPDDVVIPVYAHRFAKGTHVAVPFQGKASVQSGAVGGSRAEIRGVVRNEAGRGFAGVEVTATLRHTARKTTVHTDTQGRFTIPDLTGGIYDVDLASPSLSSSRYERLLVDSGARGTIETVLPSWSTSSPVLSVYGGDSEDQDLAAMPGDGAVIIGRNFQRAEAERAGVGRAFGPVGGVPGGVLGGVAGGMPAEMPAPPPPPMAGHGDERLRALGYVQNVPAAKSMLAEGNFKSSFSDAFKDDSAGAVAAPRIRSFFPETLYTNPALVTDGSGRASIRVPLADSITTWRVTSLASTTKGALGSSNAPVQVFQDFFIDLDLPVAVTKGDVLSVPVAVHNYLPTAQRVMLELRVDPWFSLDDDVATKSIDVGAEEVAGAQFRILASRIGVQQLQVTARLEHPRAGAGGDAVARTVEVRPDGEEHEVVVNDRLEKSVTREVVVPANAAADATRMFVKLYPGAIAQVVEGLDAILQMPGGCFEQTSSSTYPDVLVLDYLKSSKKLTPEVRAKAEQYVSLGYQRLVTFEVPGGGYSWFGDAPANKILTAFGLMEFSDMSRVHEVDPRIIARTQGWLASQQRDDGSFAPDTSFINEGATSRYNTDVVRITAYVGWALAATGYTGDAVDRARRYVTAHVTGKEDAYTAAVIANFAADFARDAAWTDAAIEALARKASEDAKAAHWSQDGETPTSARAESADLETTALAAQALLKSGKRNALAKKALDYLTSRKDARGNWDTTQATILALKAILLSTTKGQQPDTEGTVEVAVDGRNAGRVTVTKEDNDLLRTIDLKGFTHVGAHRIDLTFTGRGSLQYQIVGRYYTPWEQARQPVAAGPLAIDVTYDRTRLAQDETATAKVRATNTTAATAKWIMVDLGIPPGFEPSAADFQALVESTSGRSGGRLEKFTITAKQVILYFDGLGPRQTVELAFKLRAKFPVRAKTFSSRVYEYYNPSVEARTKPVAMTVVARK